MIQRSITTLQKPKCLDNLIKFGRPNKTKKDPSFLIKASRQNKILPVVGWVPEYEKRCNLPLQSLEGDL